METARQFEGATRQTASDMGRLIGPSYNRLTNTKQMANRGKFTGDPGLLFGAVPGEAQVQP
jgi:hypothetical protein